MRLFFGMECLIVVASLLLCATQLEAGGGKGSADGGRERASIGGGHGGGGPEWSSQQSQSGQRVTEHGHPQAAKVAGDRPGPTTRFSGQHALRANGLHAANGVSTSRGPIGRRNAS